MSVETATNTLGNNEASNTQAGADNNQLPLLSTAKAGTEKVSGSDANQDNVTPKPDGENVTGKTEIPPKVEGVADKKQEVAQVPEKYDFKIPEGVTLDEKVMEKVTELFKANGLSQEQAQAMMDFNINTYKSNQDELVKSHENQKKEWQSETETEFGGEYDRKMAIAAKARDAFASKELVELLVDSGLEHNVHVIKFFEKIGSRISEDKLVEGSLSNGNDLSKLSSKERLEYHIRQDAERLKNKT